jgi:hypothetical protein
VDNFRSYPDSLSCTWPPWRGAETYVHVGCSRFAQAATYAKRQKTVQSLVSVEGVRHSRRDTARKAVPRLFHAWPSADAQGSRERLACMHDAGATPPAPTIGDVVAKLQQRIDALPPRQVHRRAFITTYQRTTQAVGDAVDAAFFEDPEWVVRWDIAFAELFIVAHDADQARGSVPRPWRLAFQADPKLPTLIHLLLGMNAHINYDLPQATLSVITNQDFRDSALINRRRRDHERIDKILANRVTAEDHAVGGTRRLVDRILTPANRLSSRRFLREARHKVWLNVAELQRARLDGADAYDARLAELEVLSAAKIADLLRPGQVLLRLALTGFGVTLPPP